MTLDSFPLCHAHVRRLDEHSYRASKAQKQHPDLIWGDQRPIYKESYEFHKYFISFS